MKKLCLKIPNLSRRKFIIDSAAVGGGLAVGFNVPFGFAADAKNTLRGTEVNAWVVVRPDSTCVIRIARSEMGQGTLTGLAQLVAEELECDWKKVSIEQVTAGENLARKRVWGEMGTGGSRGIRISQDYVRRGGAAARMMLLQAAADQWKVPVGELSVADGVITHAPSKRSTTYGKVAAAAAKLTPPDPKSIKLKDPKDWKIAGKPMKRLDTADKLNGSKVFAIDLKLPGMLHAAIRQCPVFGGKLVELRRGEDRRHAGREARREGQRLRRRGGRRHLVAREEGARRPAHRLGRRRRRFRVERDDRGAPQGRIDRERRAVCRMAGRRCAEGDRRRREEGRSGLQHALPRARDDGADELHGARHRGPRRGLGADAERRGVARRGFRGGRPAARQRRRSTSTTSGGGFGRRGGTQDYTRQAVAIAKQFPGVPIKLIWSREEDMTHDFYRPDLAVQAGRRPRRERQARRAARSRLRPVDQRLRESGRDQGRQGRPPAAGLYDKPGDAQLGYTVPNLLIEYAMRNTHVPVGPWRGVNTNQNGVYMECFIEEVARAAGADSLEFRRALMQKHPKHLAVLNAAAEKGGWGKPLPAGVHRGIAQFMGYGSYSAAVAEVSVSDKGEAEGAPHGARAQLRPCGQSGPDRRAGRRLGRLWPDRGALRRNAPSRTGAWWSLNFNNYQILRLAEMPKVETVIVPTYDFWGGVGEPTICVVTPAVLNAIFAATGKPVRSLPLKNVKLV